MARMHRTLRLVAVAACAVTVGSATSPGSAGRSNPCDLTLAFGRRWQSPPGQLHVDLVFVHDRYDAPCRVAGFPDVELIGPVLGDLGALYPLPDRAGRAGSITLRAHQRAHAVLTWLPASLRSDRWVPGYIRVAVPTSREQSFAMALPWRFGSVLRQDAATHPGTFVGPIRPGAH
jgi:hypothetical protein